MTPETQRAVVEALRGKKFRLYVIEWEGEIRCVYLNNYRIAGDKPWGGGDVVAKFEVRGEDIINAFPDVFLRMEGEGT